MLPLLLPSADRSMGALLWRVPCSSKDIRRADERTRTADLISLRVINHVLQGFAYDAYLEGFPFPALPSVAPYCVLSGVKMVSGVRGLRMLKQLRRYRKLCN